MQEKFSSLFEEFFESEKASGILLIVAMVISLLLTNSAFGTNYLNLWDTVIGIKVGSFELYKSLSYWINEGLMAFFFLLVGLEIERELYIGELSTGRKALLPVVAAFGGMIIPGFLYAVVNYNTPTSSGFGIPMATDIAFSLGILSLLGKGFSFQLKIFLTALAIIDDLGSIIIIAIFYVGNFSVGYFAGAAGVFIFLVILNRLKVKSISLYFILGGIMWYFLLKSGVHASITGVLVAFVIPFGRGEETSPSRRLQHILHIPVTLIVVPLFVLANTGILLSADIVQSFFAPNTIGIISGLFIGKPLGIFLFCYLVVKAKFAILPEGVSFKHILGIGFIAGIGFTMSIFITVLAFTDPGYISSSKMAILIGSALSAVIGFLLLRFIKKTN